MLLSHVYIVDNYRSVMNYVKLINAAVADLQDRSRPVITNMIRLLKLPVPVQRRVAAGVLSAGHARALLGVKTGSADQEELAARIIAEGLSVRQTEEAVTLLNNGGKKTQKKPAPKAEIPATVQAGATRLSDALDTTVKVSMGRKKGRIVIDFGDADDAQRIIDLLTSRDSH